MMVLEGSGWIPILNGIETGAGWRQLYGTALMLIQAPSWTYPEVGRLGFERNHPNPGGEP